MAKPGTDLETGSEDFGQPSEDQLDAITEHIEGGNPPEGEDAAAAAAAAKASQADPEDDMEGLEPPKKPAPKPAKKTEEEEAEGEEPPPAGGEKPGEQASEDNKERIKELSRKAAKDLTKEEQKEIEDYVLNRFRGKPEPNKEIAKSYFYAEKALTKQGQAFAEARQRIAQLEGIISSMQASGQDTTQAQQALGEAYAAAATAAGTAPQPQGAQRQAQQPAANPVDALIQGKVNEAIAPIITHQQAQAQLAKDAMTIQTMKTTYKDFTEMENLMADIIRARKVDISAPDRIERAYLMAKGIKAQEITAQKEAEAQAQQAAAAKKAAKEKAKAAAYTAPASGGGENTGEETYEEALKRATESGNAEDWQNLIAKHHI